MPPVGGVDGIGEVDEVPVAAREGEEAQGVGEERNGTGWRLNALEWMLVHLGDDRAVWNACC